MNTMMETAMSSEELAAARERVLAELGQIRSLVRGALTEQFLEVKHKGKRKPVKRGPYFVLSRSVRGRTRSCRVKQAEVARVNEDIENYKCVQALCEEFVLLTERLGEAERHQNTSEAVLKKTHKSPLSKAKKSRT